METIAPAIAGDLAPPELISRYEAVIGLEVHVQLSTRTKIFCGCPTSFGAAPNSNVCPVCLGLPGALPVLSREAVELAIRGALALNCSIQPVSRFARKNYFYPDLPKGYQISQFDQPFAVAGSVDIVVNGSPRRIRVTRVHMEDDAGKSQHEGFRDSAQYTYVDLNRSGTPLIEIVSEPDMRSSDEAFAYLTELKSNIQFVGSSTCDMEKGHLRCDANVSVRPRGVQELGTKVEVKNLNSFRFLKHAIDYETARQVAVVESGGRIHQETRLYDSDAGITVGMRSKEQAHDYRYFPEPDLAPLRIGSAWLNEIQSAMPELPGARRTRFIAEYGLREYDAAVLTSARALAEYYEQAAAISGDPKITANWVIGDLAGMLKAEGRDIETSPVPPHHLGELVGLVVRGELTGKLAKDVLAKMFSSGESPAVIVEREGLKSIADTGSLEKLVAEAIAANPKQVDQYRAGKTTVIGFLVGQIMKASKGQASPGAVNELLKSKLG